MKRLHEGQSVWLSAALRDGPSRQCSVVATYHATVALVALDEPLSDRGGAPTDYYLVFEHEERPVALRGRLDIDGDDLRFHTTDGVVIDQRAAPRLAEEHPIELIATERGYAEPIQGLTASYSADGALLKDARDLQDGEPVRFTFTPLEGLTISGRGVMVANTDGRMVVAFKGADHSLRARLVDHVIASKRQSIQRDHPVAA